ncbi:hypothetical protein ACFL2Q_13710 [Thermodesulfobacteriota bacterium]
MTNRMNGPRFILAVAAIFFIAVLSQLDGLGVKQAFGDSDSLKEAAAEAKKKVGQTFEKGKEAVIKQYDKSKESLSKEAEIRKEGPGREIRKGKEGSRRKV